MSKTVLEQALDHLLNKEEDKAAALLHSYYVGVGRQVYEDIMADDHDFEDEGEHADHASDAVSEVESDLTEEGDEFAPEMGDEEATDDLGSDLGGDDGAMPADSDSADVADAMMDVESALAKLKAEFEEMVSGEGDNDEGMSDEFGAEETGEETGEEQFAPESIEEAMELQRVAKPANTEGQGVGSGSAGSNATNTQSPVAKRNPMMARPATQFGGGTAQGVPSGTSPAKAPGSKDLGYTTKPAVSKVSKPGAAPGREAGSSSSDLPKRG
jgi:hypothetical protein